MESEGTNLSGSMVSTWIIVLWVIITLWFCAIMIAFRRHIRIIIKRIARFLGLISLYKQFKKCFGRRSSQEELGLEKDRQRMKTVNYEIYDPNTGRIVDQQFGQGQLN